MKIIKQKQKGILTVISGPSGAGKDSIVNELITAMKDRLPPGQNLANFLTDTLCIGREAVYRRLRGEVAFTIDEVAQISCKLGSDHRKSLV